MLLQVLSGHDPRDPASLRNEPDDYMRAVDNGVKGLRIAWSPDFGYGAVDYEVRKMASEAAHIFEELGCTVEEADLGLDQQFDTFWTIFTANIFAAYGQLLEENSEDLTSYASDCIEHGMKVTGSEYTRALGEVDLLKARFADLYERFDLVMSPTVATTAFPVGEPPKAIGGREVHWFWGFLPCTFPINLIGHPAASVPCGFSSEKLPIGLHIIGRRGDEARVIAASAAFEQARPWIDHKPPVS
jgi:aspartyl-tRNA(Asn)/glutamyl-tRNA(Gln) amidotransferase subunit A